MLVELDEHLFTERGWFALAASNERVPAVVVPSLRDGLRLIGRGPVTAIVGRLRDGVRVVDVDLAGARGDAAVDLICTWCVETGLWHLVRPSGGTAGRAHVFVAHGEHLQALEDLLERLRGQLRTGRRGLDLRDTVRPLSSPHRSGVATKPNGRPTEALLQLKGHSWAQNPAERPPRASERPATATPAIPLRRRALKPLPEPWQAYIDHGARPLIRGDDTEGRSNYEATATAFLLRAGHDAHSAWQVVTTAHPDAFAKARQQGRAWWTKYVWNPAVAADDAFRPDVRVDEDLARDVAAARARLETLAWRLPTRQRPALLVVGHAVCDRMLRTRTRRVPVPERDLVLDTGIADRKTVRAALRAMNGAVGVLDTTTWDPTHKRDSSSYEFEIPQDQGEGLRQIPPPRSHPPTPLWAWSGLPRTCHQLWRALLKADTPVTTPELAQQALLTERPDQQPSPSQVRAVREALTAMALVGLAECTEAGQWVARHALAPEHVERSRRRHGELEASIAAERAAYRSPCEPGWNVARAAAMKAQRAKEVCWWRALPAAERARRQGHWEQVFAGLSVHEQERRKADLAERRTRAGVDEAARHNHWLDSLSWDEVVHRSVQRATDFARQPKPLQQELAASWARHRARYGIPRGTPTSYSRLEYAAVLPDTRQTRDEQFWQDQLPADPPDAETG